MSAMSLSRLTLNFEKNPSDSESLAHHFAGGYEKCIWLHGKDILNLLNNHAGAASDAALALATAIEAPSLCAIMFKIWIVHVIVRKWISTVVNEPQIRL